MSLIGRLWESFRDEPLPVDPTGDPARVADVLSVLAELRPLFQADGGDVHLVAVEQDGSVLVRLTGACAGCASSAVSIHEALEPRLRARLAWVRAVHRA